MAHTQQLLEAQADHPDYRGDPLLRYTRVRDILLWFVDSPPLVNPFEPTRWDIDPTGVWNEIYQGFLIPGQAYDGQAIANVRLAHQVLGRFFHGGLQTRLLTPSHIAVGRVPTSDGYELVLGSRLVRSPWAHRHSPETKRRLVPRQRQPEV